jgi:type II secretory pathway component PulL
LNYTSQYLDSAFKEYKSNFPDWSKYENVEDQALNKVAEMNQIAEAFRTGKQVDDFSTSYELQKKLEEYQSLIRDVEGARK